MSGAREVLIRQMIADGWKRIGSGQTGELWKLDDRQVAVPFGLTPDHFEWDGVIARVNGTDSLAERRAADRDLMLYGMGCLIRMGDGNVRRIDPRRIRLTDAPAETPPPDAESWATTHQGTP